MMIIHKSLRDNKSPHVSKTLLSILADLNIAVVCIVSTRPFISISSSPIINPSLTLPKAPINRHFHVPRFFFQFSSKVQVLILLFIFFQFYYVVNWDSKVQNFASSLFFVDYYKVWSYGRD